MKETKTAILVNHLYEKKDLHCSRYYGTTADGKRLTIAFYCNDRPVYRTTNKRTGRPLKKAVVDHVVKNAVHIDTQIDEATPWHSREWLYDHNARRYDLRVYDKSYRYGSLEKWVWNQELTLNNENVLKIINRATGLNYENIMLVDRCSYDAEKPAAWEKIQKQEELDALHNMIEEEIYFLSSRHMDYMTKGRNDSPVLLERIAALQATTGVCDADEEKIKRITLAAGGWREKNILSGLHCIIKLNNIYTIYNLTQDQYKTINYFMIKDNRITC